MEKEKQKFLTRLRNKSEHEKKIFAFFAAGIVTIIVFIVWIIAFTTTVQENSLENKKDKTEPGPFKVLINQIKKGL